MEIKNNRIKLDVKAMLILFVLAALFLLIFVNLSAFFKNGQTDPTSTTSPPNDSNNPGGNCPVQIVAATALMTEDSNHQWTATVISGNSWLSITGQTAFTGNGFVNYTALPNYGPNSRFGIILMNGYQFTVEQRGVNSGYTCSADVSPNSIYANKYGATVRLYVNPQGTGDNWSVQIFEADSNWISATKAADYVDIKIEPNERSQRISYFTVADRRIPIIQQGNIP
jgi:hypothetical protein